MDADEEDFVFYGTPIGREEETSFRKRKAAADAGQLRTLPPWKQEVRDEDGRRRFHGAFTGGFSAGYYNTVGSKEGWTPQTFTSSRKNRAELKQQNVYNFLDEDEREEMDGHALETSSKFDTFGLTAAEMSRKQAEKDLQKRPSVIPGPVPDELLTPATNSIGVKLLVKMGWRHGHSIDKTHTASLYDSRREARKAFLAFSGNEPKSDVHESYANRLNYEASVKEPDDDNAIYASQSTPLFVLNPKQNLHGLGYDPFKHAPEFSERKRSLHTSRRKDKGSRSTASRKDNLFSSNSGKLAPGFGIGALEELDIEDEDIYDSGFEIVETCIDEVEPPSRTDKGVKLLLSNKKQTSLSGFMCATNSDYSLERFQPPHIPPSFKPQHKFPAPLDASITYHDCPPSEVPPPDDNNIKIMVEGFAALVSRCGKLFEDLSREKNKDNPLFCFLSGGNGYDYYARKLWEEKQKRVDQKKPLMEMKSSSAQKLTAEVRGRALGEKPLEKSTTSPVSSVGLSEVHLQSNLSDNFTKPSSHIAFSEFSKPFKDDPAKQERFEQFFKDKFEGGLRSSDGTSRWSENDRARERLDFEAILESIQKGSASDGKSNLQSMQQKPVFPTISESQFVNAGLEMVHAKSEEKASSKNYPKREEFQWRPAPILCKRFDITDPFMGKPPPPPRPRSKMESFVFTSDFIKSEKVEEKAVPAISSLQSDSRLNNIQQQTTTAQPDIETNEKAVHKPVDLYKAIFSDDSDDEGVDNAVKRKIDDPDKKVEGANTTLNRLVAGDFLESLGKELGLAIPTSATYPAKKTIEMQGDPTVGNDGEIPSDCIKVGPISGALGRLISSSGEEIDEQVGRHTTSLDENAAVVTSKGDANGPNRYIEQMNVNVERESLTKRQKNHQSHKANSSSTSDSDLSRHRRSRDHRKGKDKREKTKHKSKRKRSLLRHRDSSFSDSDSSRHHGSVEHLDVKVARDNNGSSKKHRRHQEDGGSDSERFSGGERYNGGSRSKAQRKSSKVENRKHSRHHRHRNRSSPDWSTEEDDRKKRRSENHQREFDISKSDRYRQHR